MFQLTLNLDHEPTLKFGQRVYYVTCTKTTYINEKCPICDDTRTVIIRGVEFRCPSCQTSYASKNSLSIHQYSVVEAIINSVTVKGEDAKRAYPSNGNYDPIHNIKFDAVYTTGRCDDDRHHVGVEEYRVDVDMSFFRHRYDNPSAYFFSAKKPAQEFCNHLIALEKAELEKFCSEHGVDREYPY